MRSSRITPFSYRIGLRRHPKAMALVLALAMIVLVSVAVLAFFTRATSHRMTETSRSAQMQAELLASTGTTSVIGKIAGQIAEFSDTNTLSGVSIYTPKSRTDALPRRAISENISASNAAFFNLIGQSVPAADNQSSTHSTGSAARNGRGIHATQWNQPELIAGSGFSDDNQLPNWIYVDRIKGLVSTPSADTIGRIAYNLYDVGGLLAADIAGYPSNVTDDLMIYLKTGMQGANLQRLSPTVTQSGVNSLLSFRFPDAPPTRDYVDRMLGATANGFLSRKNTAPWSGQSFQQNTFTSRQDLIRYMRLQNPGLRQVLPYLTHFSRSVNAPSWKPPSTPANTNPDVLNVRFPEDAKIKHYDDKGVQSEYPVKAGDPLVQRRFSLAKLAWLSPSGPANGVSDEAIQSAFGLRWDRVEEHWDYVGASGSARRDSILTLEEVARETTLREPNFFELLKAGILTGSLGAAAKAKQLYSKERARDLSCTACAAGSIDLDKDKDLHILKIGANIVDAADADNYPTILALDSEGIAIERAGVEDLPYFYCLDLVNLRVSELTRTDEDGYKFYSITLSDFALVPELFSPHQGSTATMGPASIRIEIMNGFLKQVGYGSGGGFSSSKSVTTLNTDLSLLPPITLDRSTFDSFRSAPAPVRNKTAMNRLAVTVPYVAPSVSDIGAFHLFSYADPNSPTLLPFELPHETATACEIREAVISLRYETLGGKFKTYVTLGGDEAFPEDTGLNGIQHDFGKVNVFRCDGIFGRTFTNIDFQSTYLLPWDPRSSRFGPALGRYQRLVGALPRFNGTGLDVIEGIRPFLPTDYFQSASPATAFAGNLPQMPAFEDPDFDSATGPRPPDGNIGFAMPGTAGTAANPYKNITTNSAARPSLPQRPYRSVAELGYAFRDTPWQTLNFWNNRSGDAALLDLFSVFDEPGITAGRIALNTRQAPVLKALLDRSAQKADGTGFFTDAEIDTIAASVGTKTFSNVADISSAVSDLPTSLGTMKNRREAVSRSLGATQTRTWNLLIDLVAQSGRFPYPGKLAAGDFVVAGEDHSWTSVAIDRYTAHVIAEQVEDVHE